MTYHYNGRQYDTASEALKASVYDQENKALRRALHDALEEWIPVRKALIGARDALLSLPKNCLGESHQIGPSGESIEFWPVRDELVAKLSDALERITDSGDPESSPAIPCEVEVAKTSSEVAAEAEAMRYRQAIRWALGEAPGADGLWFGDRDEPGDGLELNPPRRHSWRDKLRKMAEL